MKNKKILAIIGIALCTMSLAACTSESKTTTSFNVTTETDDGTTEYSYISENNNGEVTEDESYTETPADDSGEVVGDSEEAVEYDPALVEAAEWIDSELTSVISEDEGSHHTTYDENEIYSQIYYNGAETVDDLDEEAMKNDIIPIWVDNVTNVWRSELDSRGLENIELCLQFVSENGEDVFFTIEGGELVYSVYDDVE